MPFRVQIKQGIIRRGLHFRVLSGPARGVVLSGPESLRVYAGLYEVELNKWIRQLIRPRDNVFDIGGQYGYDALLFAQLTDGLVLSVDSDPESILVMDANIARNYLGDRLLTRNAAVGDGTDGSVTLDLLAAETFRPDFVKMDIEGGEVAAIAGAKAVLDMTHSWLIEVHSRDAERVCINALSHHGYDLDLVNPRRWIPDRRIDPHNRWLIGSRQ
jgi:hypothetical protein